MGHTLTVIDSTKSKKRGSIYKFCKKNKIDVTWDFNHNVTTWYEILVDGNLILQIENTATVDQFKTLIGMLNNNFRMRAKYDIPGDDFWFAVSSKPTFNKFIKKHGEIFNIKNDKGRDKIRK